MHSAIKLNKQGQTYRELATRACSSLHAIRTGPAQPHTSASPRHWNKAFRKIPRICDAFACASLLLCLVPASAFAQQQSTQQIAGLAARGSSLPERPLPKTTDTDGSASVTGTVLDVSGASVAGAEVSLMHKDGTELHAMLSGVNGEFNFAKIPSGSYLVLVNAKDFAPFTSPEFVVAAEQIYDVPSVSLSVAAASTEMTVRSDEFIAAEQIKAAEKQRLVGIIPNFYTSYIYDAVPPTVKQKFSMAARGTFASANSQSA